MLTWQLCKFEALSARQWHDIVRLRMEVFVVEQNCVYQDVDGHDVAHGVQHLMGIENGELVAYARLLPPGLTYDNVSIGRIVTSSSTRGRGLGHQLVGQALSRCDDLWPGVSIEIGAQEHLQGFYASHGFVAFSEAYLEDGIPHVDMCLDKS
ncbi:ElaA protein [Ferrimonas sediminum]|uniref:Protein ElaA n=2 Tax=Ferrimonas sediminum TaxID=718193 RepID=A0A1G8TVS1_9GAMM|nr:GNAT family N-acetyltransferase [Ferrimonas sediminum]SDJ45611.1 ElaA protein [Ferrimonas sediminum]